MTKLMGDILVQFESDEENIYIPRKLMEACEKDKLTFGLLANAMLEASSMSVEELSSFKEKWGKR